MGGAQAVENDAMPCAAEIKQKVLSSSEVGILPANVSIDSCIAAYISLWKSECNFSFRDWAICGGGTLPCMSLHGTIGDRCCHLCSSTATRVYQQRIAIGIYEEWIGS